MGGSSSKSCRRKPTPGPHSLEELSMIESSTTSNSKCVLVSSMSKENKNKAKNKKAKKNNVKISSEAKKRKREKDSKKNQSGNSITVIENTDAAQSPVYRKKSSCPSCEARELLKGRSRERSGSEKSLRYSDFNKVQRKTRIYDWELQPVDIPLYGVAEPIPDETCYVCGVYTGRLVRTCRVCYRSFHDGCLAKIGHGLTDAARALLKSNLWSCHQCASLNHLLTQEELKSAMHIFDNIDLNTERITVSDYLSYCQASLQHMGKEFTEDMQEACVDRFRRTDKSQSGSIIWSQFLNLESVRILQHRCKDSLVRLLTQPELSEARRIFQNLDPQKTGFTTKQKLCAALESGKQRGSGYYPDENRMYGDNDLDNGVSWEEFLRDRVIYILAQRPNLCKPGSDEDDFIEDGAMTPSFESIGEGEPIFNTHSEEYPVTNETLDQNLMVQSQVSSTDQLSSLNISTSILDDLTSELIKRCSNNSDVNAVVKSDSVNSVVYEHTDSDAINAPGPSEKNLSERQNSVLQKGEPDPDCQTSEGKEPFPRRKSGVASFGSGYRKSEIITSEQDKHNAMDDAKSARQIKSKSMHVAPVYGGLVGKMRCAEWNC